MLSLPGKLPSYCLNQNAIHPSFQRVNLTMKTFLITLTIKCSFFFFQLPVAAAAKSLHSCPTLWDLIDGSPPGSSVLGFSSQEYWSGLPFPSPMHESEKWKSSHSSCLTLRDPMDCSLPGSSCMGFSRQEYWSGVPLPSPSNFLPLLNLFYLLNFFQVGLFVMCHTLPCQLKTLFYLPSDFWKH